MPLLFFFPISPPLLFSRTTPSGCPAAVHALPAAPRPAKLAGSFASSPRGFSLKESAPLAPNRRQRPSSPTIAAVDSSAPDLASPPRHHHRTPGMLLVLVDPLSRLLSLRFLLPVDHLPPPPLTVVVLPSPVTFSRRRRYSLARLNLLSLTRARTRPRSPPNAVPDHRPASHRRRDVTRASARPSQGATLPAWLSYVASGPHVSVSG